MCQSHLCNYETEDFKNKNRVWILTTGQQSSSIFIFKTILSDILPVLPDACSPHEYNCDTEDCFENKSRVRMLSKADIPNRFINLKLFQVKFYPLSRYVSITNV